MALQLFIPPTTSINVLLNNHSTIQINSNNNTLNCYLNVKSPSDWQKCIQNEKLIIDSIDSPPKLKNLDKFKSDHQKNFVRDDRLRSSRGALNSKRDNIKYTSKHPYRKAYNSQLNDINGYSEAYQLDGFGNEDKYGNVLKNAYENFYKDSYRDDYKNVDEEDQLENGSTDPKDRPRLKYRKKIRKKNKINNSHLIISKLSTSLLKETFDSEEDRPIDEAEFENEENDKSHENTDDGHNEDHDENYYKQTNKDRLLSKFDRFDLLNKKFYSTISEDLSPLPVLLKSSTNNIETNQKNQISTSLKPHLNPITLMGNQSTKHKSLLIKEPLENNLNHSFISNKRMRKSKEVANSKLDKRIDSKLNSELDGRLNVEIKKSKKQTNLISPNDKNSRILVRSANDNLDFNYHSMNGPLVYDLLTDQRSNKSFIATNVSRDALKIEQSSAIFNRLLDHRSDYEFKLPSTARLIQRENSEEKIKEKKSLKFDKQSEQSFNDKDPFDREEFANRFKFTTTQSTLDNVHNRTSLSYLSSSSNSSSLSKDSSISSLNSSSDNLLNDKILNTDPLPIEINIKFVLLLIGAVFLSLITMLGNILVMISLIIDRQLRTISNYYLLSLSVADFMIGFISMPLYTLYLLLDRWPLSPLICDTWLALDYLMSNASVLNLLAISVDRYLSVTRPLTYRAKRTTKKALCWIASTWIISSLLWPPWIFYWPHYEGKRTVPKNECYIQFLQSNPYITFITAIAAFYIPVLTMIFLNFRIWRETQQRYRDITTLFLVSTAGKVVKNGNTTKKDFDSQRSTTMTASVGTTNQPSITILSGNNTLTSFDMADCSWNETDHSLSSDDEIGNYQQSDFEISSTNQKSKSVGPSLEPVFMMNNSTKERITTTLSRFSILLMNGEKFSKSVRRDLEKDAKELVNVLIESPIRSDEQNQSNQSSTEFRFKITMKEKNQLIDQLIKNKDYASSESVSKKIKKDLVSNNYKLITSLFHQSLRPVDGNEIYDFNVNQSVSLNDSSSGHQETNETQSDVNPIEYLNETKDTPPKHENIWEAIRQQDLKAVDYFIRIKKIDPNLKRKDGWILLHFASEYGNLEIVKYLVSKGADINAGDIDSNLPLHWACHNGKLEIVEYFISDLKMDPNPKGNYNDTCLHIAVRSNNLELVKYLVSKGADINARNKYSNLPLSLACYYGKLEIVKYFISELRMDVNSKGFHNSTCLHHAVQSNNLELVKFLIENGAKKSLHEKNNSETTPLEGAELWNKKKELIEYLRCQMS